MARSLLSAPRRHVRPLCRVLQYARVGSDELTAYVTSAEEMAYHMGQTILIAHNQAALCHTLRVVLGFMPCVGIVRKASECASVVAQAAELRADAVVLPLAGSADLELMRQLRAAGFGGRIVALTTSGTSTLTDAAKAAGANVVLDTADASECWLSVLHGAVCAMCGGVTTSPDVSSRPR